jgi:GNAT superfamily N-acetyltransferase
MKIRFGQKEDWEAVLQLSRAMFAESRFRNLSLDETKAAAVYSATVQNPAASCAMLACREDGEVVGMLLGQAMEYFFCDGVMVQDRVFYVLPEYRGSSAAVKLLTALRRWAENRKAVELCVNMSVAIDTERFNKLMVHLGFKYCGSNFSLSLMGGEK